MQAALVEEVAKICQSIQELQAQRIEVRGCPVKKFSAWNSPKRDNEFVLNNTGTFDASDRKAYQIPRLYFFQKNEDAFEGTRNGIRIKYALLTDFR